MPLVGMTTYLVAVSGLLKLCLEATVQGIPTHAMVVIVLYLSNEELRRLYEGKCRDSGEGVRALSVFSALITTGAAGMASVTCIEHRYACGLAALTIARGLMVAGKYAALESSGADGKSLFISGEPSVFRKGRNLFVSVWSCRCRDLCRELAAWRWLMQCSVVASLSSIGSLVVSMNHLHTDRDVLGISAQDAAWLAIAIAIAILFVAISSLLGDQRIKTPIIDRSFRVLATLKPLLSTAKLLVLYCPDSSECVSPSHDIMDFGITCLQPAIGGAGDLVVYDSFGACRVCCVTTNSYGLLASWKRWSIVASAILSMVITISFTFKKVLCNRHVSESEELKGMVAGGSLTVTRWAFVVLWVSSKLGLTALIVLSRFGTSRGALASMLSGQHRCRAVQERMVAAGGETMPELSTLRMFFAIVVMLALSTIVTNELSRVFDVVSRTRRMTRAMTADGARAMADLLALPAVLLSAWLATAAHNVVFGIAFKVACIALLGVTAALLALITALGRGSSRPPCCCRGKDEAERDAMPAAGAEEAHHQPYEVHTPPSALEPLLLERPGVSAIPHGSMNSMD